MISPLRLSVGFVLATTTLLTGCATSAGTPSSSDRLPAGTQAAASGGTDESTTYSSFADARITSCARNAAGHAAATVVVTNHSMITSDYMVAVLMIRRASGRELGSGDAATINLAAGRSSRPLAVDSLTLAPAGGYTCRLAQVNRFISTG